MDNKKQEELLKQIIENTKPKEEKSRDAHVETLQSLEQIRAKHAPKTDKDIIASAYDKMNEENIKKELKENGYHTQAKQDEFDRKFIEMISLEKHKTSDEDIKAMLRDLGL